MRRGDDGRPAGHRLDDRHPEALEPRWVDDRRRAAVEARELRVTDAPEGEDAGAVELRLLAPARPADDEQLQAVSGRSANASTRVPRFLRGSSVATVSR